MGGVDTMPAQICQDVCVVPLFSWYNAAFDESDPYPNPQSPFDIRCRFPVASEDVWRFMLALNDKFVTKSKEYEGTIISFSHFLPRTDLPFDLKVPGIAKAMGCEDIGNQVNRLSSSLHVYGHSRKRFSKQDGGVTYVCHSL